MERSEWIKYTFKIKELEYAIEALLALQDIGLDVLLEKEYGVVFETQVIHAHKLENKLSNEWYDYVSGDGNTFEDRLYQYAKEVFDNDSFINHLLEEHHTHSEKELESLLTDEEYEAYLTYKYEPEKAIANWSNRIRFLLKLDLQEDEAAIRKAIKKYVHEKGIAGLAGISIDNIDEIITEVDNIEDKLNLNKIYKCIKHDYNQKFEKEVTEDNPFTNVSTSDEQRRFLKILLSKMAKLDENAFGAMDTLKKINKGNYKKVLAGNVNLGLEELEMIFLKHESLWNYETKDKDQGSELMFRDEKEITDFLKDYFRITITSEPHREEYRKNFVNRLNILGATENEIKYMVTEMMNCILNETERKDFQQLQHEGRQRCELDIELIKLLRESDSVEELKTFLFSPNVYKIELKFLDNRTSILNNYYKFDVIAALMERNIRDLLLAVDALKGKEAVSVARHLLTQIERYALTERCLCMEPTRIKYYPSIHEAYVNALRRNDLQSRCKHYYNIFTSMMENCLCYDNGVMKVNPELKKCDDFKSRISSLTDKELGERLKGSRDTDIKEKKMVVKRTSEWLNSTGMFLFDVEKYSDFKVIYDILYKFKVSSEVTKNGADIKITRLKGKKYSSEDYTHYDQAYLILGAFISRLYNREDLDEEDFVKISVYIRDAIVVLFNILEIPNSDYILVLMNAFRESCLAEMELTYEV